jgi:hypothetical protein
MRWRRGEEVVVRSMLGWRCAWSFSGDCVGPGWRRRDYASGKVVRLSSRRKGPSVGIVVVEAGR